MRRGSADADQFVIGKPLSSDVLHGRFKPQLVVHAFAVVVPERLFVDVAEQMERLNRNIGAVQTAFQERPEVFDAVGMDQSVHVFVGMVDYFMLKLVSLVAAPFVGDEG